ncbi:enoyl-CoA hydratase/isomerase family protein [Zafaria sp. Z1313]|uniref:enoyl-CoA hydratase/isomerase family protein n=1 Tax=Zafaria sp. Z1313 TaxID=3423202 RepID=UPI003D3023AC
MDWGSYATLSLEQDGDALIVTVNRPEALNALANQVVDDLLELTGRLEGIGRDADWPVRGIVLTGAGAKAFVAGADIREMDGMDPATAEAYGRRMHQVTLRLEELPVPVIAAVNGFALGGGCELALACDFIYASADASFGQPEVALGLVPGFGGSVRLQQRVGAGQARELIFTGRRIDARHAHGIGLVNRVFDDAAALMDGARATIAELARVSPTAVANAKRTMHRVQGLGVAEGLEVEAESFREAFTTEDSAVGRAAFVAKERAAFPGR